MERWKDKREDKRTPIIRKKDSHFFPVEKFMGVLFFFFCSFCPVLFSDEEIKRTPIDFPIKKIASPTLTLRANSCWQPENSGKAAFRGRR